MVAPSPPSPRGAGSRQGDGLRSPREPPSCCGSGSPAHPTGRRSSGTERSRWASRSNPARFSRGKKRSGVRIRGGGSRGWGWKGPREPLRDGLSSPASLPPCSISRPAASRRRDALGYERPFQRLSESPPRRRGRASSADGGAGARYKPVARKTGPCLSRRGSSAPARPCAAAFSMKQRSRAACPRFPVVGDSSRWNKGSIHGLALPLAFSVLIVCKFI